MQHNVYSQETQEQQSNIIREPIPHQSSETATDRHSLKKPVVPDSNPLYSRNSDPKSKALPSSGLVAVVKEQATESNLAHILPLTHSTTSSATASITTSTQQTHNNNNITGVSNNSTSSPAPFMPNTNNLPAGQSHPALQSIVPNKSLSTSTSSPNPLLLPTDSSTSIPLSNKDSFFNHLKTKRSVIDSVSGNSSDDNVSLNPTTLRNKKLIANPSLSNLRQGSLQGSATNIASSTPTIQSKTSTRAEFFAARLHDAIKIDEKNNSDSDETFVYDTSTNERARPQQAQDEQSDIKSIDLEEQTKATGESSQLAPQPIEQHDESSQKSEDLQAIEPQHQEIDDSPQTTVHTDSSSMSQYQIPMQTIGPHSRRPSHYTSTISSPIFQPRPPLKDNQSDMASSQSDTVVAQHGKFGSTGSYDLGQQTDSRGTTMKSKVAHPTMPTSDTMNGLDIDLDSNQYDNCSRSSSISKPKPQRPEPMTVLSNDDLQTESDSNYNSIQSHQQSHHPPLGNGNNQLRQITSRIFDLKGVNPRRYSGVVGNEYEFEDVDDDFDEEAHFVFNNHSYGNNTNNIHNNALGFIPDDYDSDFGDDISINEQLKTRGYAAGNYGSISTLSGSYSPNQVNANGLINSNINNSYQQQPLQEPRNSKLGGNKILKRKRNNLYFSPHDFTGARTARLKQIKNFCYTISLVFLFLSLGFIGGFILATTKELQHTSIESIENVLISEEELVFSLGVRSFNPGFLGIAIQDVEIDVFAKSEFVDDLYRLTESNKVTTPFSTVLLGSLTHFDVPLFFQGGFFTRQVSLSSTEIKIVNPCSFDDTPEDDDRFQNSTTIDFNKEAVAPPPIQEPLEKWLNISRNPFDLIIRGVLKYQLPISNSNRTVAINHKFSIDPDNLDNNASPGFDDKYRILDDTF